MTLGGADDEGDTFFNPPKSVASSPSHHHHHQHQGNGMGAEGNFSAQTSDNDSELWEEFEKFEKAWNNFIAVYIPLEIVILSLGLIGNLLAFATLIRSRNLCTPTFLYHRVLVFADLLFCTNFFVNLCVEKFSTVSGGDSQFVFDTWAAAYYSGTIYHAVHVTCSYVILYMTIVIAFERFMALLLFRHYGKFNEHWVARTVATICISLSVFVHSWAPWLQRKVIEVNNLHTTDNASFAVYYTWVNRQHFVKAEFILAKDIYNVALRVAYPVVVTLLTAGVIYGFARRQRHICRRYGSNGSTTGLQKSRYEKTLFFFMISVIILAFVQIGPAECQRIVRLIYPPGETTKEKVANQKLPMSERLYYFRRLLYGIQLSRIISNLCTVINHCFIGYLYMAMNNLFRRELLALLCCRPAAPSGLLRARTSSYGQSGLSSAYNTVTARDDSRRKESKTSRRSKTTSVA